MTDEQLSDLADLLIDTNSNVFTICKTRFNVEVDDEIFDKLEKYNIFHCDECGMWLPLTDEDEFVLGTCKECVYDDE